MFEEPMTPYSVAARKTVNRAGNAYSQISSKLGTNAIWSR